MQNTKPTLETAGRHKAVMSNIYWLVGEIPYET